MTGSKSVLGSGRAHALLIGSGTYDPDGTYGPGVRGWPAVKSARRSVERLRDILIERCGLPADGVTELHDPEDSRQVLDYVDTAASCADGGLLLLYFVGHGAPDFDRQGQGLRLMTRHSAPPTAPGAYSSTSQVSFHGILDIVRNGKESRPQPAAVVAILDCCMADRGAADMTNLKSYFFLAAATRDRQAMAPPDADFPLFTGRLIELLEKGAPEFGPDIRLADLADLLCQTMPEGAPVPKVSGSAGHLVLAPNPHPEAFDRVRPQRTRTLPVTGRCPYPGLAAFTEQEQRWFRGREYDADVVVVSLTAVQASRLPVVLTGASGSGKTSFVQAALRPRLAAVALEGRAGRRCTTLLRPGSPQLVHDLARHLASLAPGADSAVFESRLREGEDGARAVAREVQTAQATADGVPAELVLIIDQFEKIYSPDITAPERTAFVSAVCALAAAETLAPWRPLNGDRAEDIVRVRVLLVVPSESSGRLEESDDRLRRALTTTQHILAPLSEDEVRQAIVEPARQEGIVVDEDFVAGVCAEFASAAAPQYGDTRTALPPARLLPYLAQALRATWEHSPRRLTLQAYHDSGRLEGAIQETAEQCFQQLDATDREIAQVLLLHLVAHNDQGLAGGLKTVTRQALLLETCDTGDPNSRLRTEKVLDRLRERRLIVETNSGITLVHQALIHAWPRMGRWIRDDRTWLTIRERIQAEARRWERDGRVDRSTPLSPFLADDFAAAAHRGGASGLTQRDWDYLNATMASREQELQQRRQGRRRQRITAAIAVLSCMAATAGTWIGINERASSASARHERTASQLAAAAQVTAARQPDLAARLAVASYRAAHTPTSWTALLENAAQVRPTPLSNAVTSQLTGTRLAVGAGTAASVTAKGITLDATADGHRVAVLLESTGVTEIAFGHRGQILAGIDAHGSIRIWDTGQPRRPPRVFATGVPIGEIGTATTSLTFSADDAFLAVAAGEEAGTEATHPFATEVWQIPHEARPTRKRVLPDGYAVFTGSGTTLAQVDGAGKWLLEDAARPQAPGALSLARRSMRATCFSPDGTAAAQVCARHRPGQRRPAAAGRQPAASTASAACRATRPGSPRYALRASRHSPLPRRGGPGLGGRRSSRPSRRRPAACPGAPPYGDFGDLKQQGQVSA